jgi:hypothetical protein
MTKIRILGSPQKQIQVGNHFVAGQTVLDLDDKELKEYDGFYMVEETNKTDKPKEPKAKKYTEKQLYKLNKLEQIEILKELGVEKIPRLEKGKVNAILEAQK